MDTPRLLRLLDAHFDARLTTEEAAALRAELTASAAARRLFWESAQQHALLGELLAESQGEQLALQEQDLPLQQPRPAVRRQRRSTAAALLLAAGLLLAVSLAVALWPAPLPVPPPRLAQVEEVQGEVYLISHAGKVLAAPRQPLLPGQQLQTRGEGSFAVVRLPDATRLELAADTTINLGAERAAQVQVNLEEGAVLAEVAPQPDGRPMLLATRHAEIFASGNKLSFSSEPSGTYVELEEGRAELRRKSDGKKIALVNRCYAVASAEGPMEPRTVPNFTTQPRRTFTGAGHVQVMAFAQDGKRLATGTPKGFIRVWDVGRGALLRTVSGGKQVRGLGFAPAGDLLASLAGDRQLRFWDLAVGKEVTVLAGTRLPPHGLEVAPGGHLLATIAGNRKQGEVRLWDVSARRTAGSFPVLPGESQTLAFAPDGQTLATGGREGIVTLWEVATRREVRALNVGAEVRALAFTADGQTLLTAGGSGAVKVWDPQTGAERATFAVAPGARLLAFAPDGRRLAVAGAGGSVTLWDIAGARVETILKGHRQGVTALRFAPDSVTLATAGGDKTIRLWTVAVGAGAP